MRRREGAEGEMGEGRCGRVGELANGRKGEWANGRMGERANGRMGEWANGRMGVWACSWGGRRWFLGAQRSGGEPLCRLADLLVRSHRKASGETGGSRERLSAGQSYLICGMAEVVDRPIEQNTP